MTKIMVVDDEKIIRNAMLKTFGKYGECTPVESGTDAMTVYKKALKDGKPFDMIILDISLEDKSGLDVLKEIRSTETEKEIPREKQVKIIMATGHREKKIVKDCIAAGCNDYVLKPLKPETIVEKLNHIGIAPMAEE